MLASKYEATLGKDEANYEPLSPIAFLERSALVYPAKPAIIDGERIITYADMWRRCRFRTKSHVGIKNDVRFEDLACRHEPYDIGATLGCKEFG